MREELRERRKEMLKLYFRGVATTDWVQKLANKYDVAESTIYRDWRNREEWVDEVFEIGDVMSSVDANMAELSNVKEEAWRVYHKAKDYNKKIGALKTIKNSVKDKLKLLQSLGEIHKEADKHKVEVEGLEGQVEDLIELSEGEDVRDEES